MKAGLCALVLLVCSRVSAQSAFGSVEAAPIAWEAPADVELSSERLRLTQPGTSIRSAVLPLQPLQLYRISSKMARGPGSATRFAITYLDASGKQTEWTPSWQFKSSAHPSWLPLSPHSVPYAQGFVLPLGATQPRLQLKLEAADKALARYHHWTVTQLRIEPTSKVLCCEKLGPDLLLGGDFELAPRDGMPGGWAPPPQRPELVDSADPARKHVLRFKAGTITYLFSSYVVPVKRSSAYRAAVSARGEGRIVLDVHSLDAARPTGLRVGNATSGAGTFDLNDRAWKQVSTLWLAEAPNVAAAQLLIIVNAKTDMELDAVELRAYER
jgi:hypothetical protein